MESQLPPRLSQMLQSVDLWLAHIPDPEQRRVLREVVTSACHEVEKERAAVARLGAEAEAAKQSYQSQLQEIEAERKALRDENHKLKALAKDLSSKLEALTDQMTNQSADVRRSRFTAADTLRLANQAASTKKRNHVEAQFPKAQLVGSSKRVSAPVESVAGTLTNIQGETTKGWNATDTIVAGQQMAGFSTKSLDGGASTSAAELEKVHSAQKVEVSDHEGSTMTKFINTSVGDGNPTEWFADSNDGGFWGVGTDSKSVVYLVERLMKENKTTSFDFHFIPNNTEMWDNVANNAVQKRVVNNSGRTDDGKPQGLPPVEGSLNQAKAEEDCPYCDRKGHALVDCFCKYPKGELFGCVCCNSKEHLADDCMLFQSMNLAEKVDWLVVKRANKPPVHTKEPWYVTLHKYCMSESFDRGAFRGFPWTIEFARKSYKGVLNLDTLTTRQRKLDETRKKIKPLVDPLTRGFEQVSSTYWQPLGLPWPNAFKSKDVVSQDVEMLGIDDIDENEEIAFGMNRKAPSPEPEPYGDEQEDVTDFS
ncbi:hypothetical protein FPSE5266_10359 [Fusarium pseudograminearum]|nr:hypothetical protein FPSE5266_10359 [Fusarium pseudograminearum]